MNVQKAQLQKPDYCPPPPEGDFYRIIDILDESERTVLKVRVFMDREVAPIIEDYWGRDQFPHEIIPKLRALDVNIAGVGYQGYGAAGGSWLLNGFIAMEMAHIVYGCYALADGVLPAAAGLIPCSRSSAPL